MKNIRENYVKPVATVEYLFIEHTDKQETPMNQDQGWISGYFNIFGNGSQDFNDNWAEFKKLVVSEMNYILAEYENFNEKTFDPEKYVFYLVENGKFAKEFPNLDESFYTALRSSSHNLMIVGKNFDVQAFSEHEIFRTWVKEYCH